MSTCPVCQLHDFRSGDRFCGGCGATLCGLLFEDGPYLEIPEDTKGMIDQVVVVRNGGRSELAFRITEATDPSLRVKGERAVTLLPFSEGTNRLFTVNANKLQTRERKIQIRVKVRPNRIRTLKNHHAWM